MKKEKKRYYLIEYCGIRRHEYNTEEELNEALERIRKYNNRKTAKYIVGNMKCSKSEDHYVLYANLYRKITQKSTISELDKFTSQFDEKELISYLYDKLISANPKNNKAKTCLYPDINIAYFEDKNKEERGSILRRIKYIPVLYKDDKKYMDMQYISNCIANHCDTSYPIDYDFFRGLFFEFCEYRSCGEELDKLINITNKVQFSGYNPNELYFAAMDLYRELIFEREKDGSIIRDDNGRYQVSERRLRDFGFFVKNYNSTTYKNAMSYSYANNSSKLAEMKALRAEILSLREGQQLEMKLK